MAKPRMIAGFALLLAGLAVSPTSGRAAASEATLGALSHQATVSESRARSACLRLPPAGLVEDYDGPERPSRANVCRPIELKSQPSDARWTVGRYAWTTRGAADASPEEEVVLLERAPGGLRPVWRSRFLTGPDAVWRSVEPSAAMQADGSTLVGVSYCVNGTGGCSPEFLLRRRSGAWTTVRQVWRDQLPAEIRGQLLHGATIDVRALTGEAPYYKDGGPNCCPSHTLSVTLALRGDQLALRRYTVSANPP